jgi:hypothetical protein
VADAQCACDIAGVQEAVCYNLKNKKIDYIRIDGSTPQKIRQDLVTYFQTKPSCRVACLSITAAGVGLTLTAASMYDKLLILAHTHTHTHTHKLEALMLMYGVWLYVLNLLWLRNSVIFAELFWNPGVCVCVSHNM